MGIVFGKDYSLNPSGPLPMAAAASSNRSLAKR
jgi:hypothetical protein